MDEKYNGWSNYETWLVNLSLTNDEGTAEFWNRQARLAVEFADHPRRLRIEGESVKDVIRGILATQLQNALEQSELLSTRDVYADLLTAALGRVDWHEIADSLLADVTPEDEPGSHE
jgi:hypothetical protein